MNDEVELKTVVSDNNNVSTDQGAEVPGNGIQEASHLLSRAQGLENNVEAHELDGVHVDHNDSSTETSKCRRELQSLKEDLNEVVVWKLRVWMVILLVVTAIIMVIAISIVVCAVEDDVDEKYDRSSFVVQRLFRGNFTLESSSSSASDPLDQQTLMEQLKREVTTVYISSAALERYFSNVTISSFQDSTAQFELQFMMPPENEQLVRYTLSVKMVRNVLLQHFYDQDSGEQLSVIPTSLRMEAF
ncbi:uncharacterized protein LOC130242287 isoform X2 [Danio aesculapii]|uniref:uncharacterized protein LOC130242287 isoform X2 n=1 Tax=Danio aesculapii TaxID=1142201 RepID=UPI0024BF2A27|nr:uncharacterized protein LOC130242287 isoform X2 [Danio aesculapii]